MNSGYLVARRNLIQALEALGDYTREAVVVVGAQAVYLQTHEIDVAPFLPFTLDSDIAVDPRILESTPPIRETLENHGYSHREGQPGLYWAPGSSDEQPLDGAAVDILVPEEFASGRGRRDAGLPGDNRGAARRTPGLEAALYDKDLLQIGDLADPSRILEAYVAGPAALLVAKAQKIVERGDDRLKAKDASDAFLLLRAFDVDELARRFAALSGIDDIRGPLARGIDAIREVFVDGARGRRLFAEALGDDLDRQELLDAYGFLTQDLKGALPGVA